MKTPRQSLRIVSAVIIICAVVHVVRAEPAETPSPAAAPIPTPLAWVSTGPLIAPRDGNDRQIVSIKDPSVVRYNDRWHIYATTCNRDGHWQMVYLSFADWAEAKDTPWYHMDQNPNLRGYHCAPQVFYFAPQNKWYLIYQSQHPQYSTTDDVANPESWSAPQDFFDGKPASVDAWIDYWVICDDTHAYLFFTGDNGKFYRSRTTLEEFPHGMSEPVVVMQEDDRRDLFEGSATYKIRGTDQYLTIIEAASPDWKRYYRAFVADRLDGDWTPLAGRSDNPFAGLSNVRFADGVEPWTRDISHGELIREGFDQTMTIDPANLQFLYQGVLPPEGQTPYHMLPYRIGLLRLDASRP